MKTMQVVVGVPWATWLRMFCLYWFLGSMAGLYLVALIEWLSPVFSQTQAWLFCTIYIPFPVVVWGFWQFLQSTPSGCPHPVRSVFVPREVPTHSDTAIVVLALLVFVVWSVCYYIAGWLSSHLPMKTLWLAADHWFPLLPATSLVYVSVQWFTMSSILAVGHLFPWGRMLMASLSIVFVCCFFFIVYPVHIHSTPLPVRDLSTWVLALIRSGDVVNNCFPSSHCAMAMFGAILLFHQRRWIGWLGLTCAIAIGISTLTTKQHYVLDVIGGFVLGAVSYVFWFVWPKPTLPWEKHYGIEQESHS